jgi:hypothetical protein
MDKRDLAYWATTGLFASAMGASSLIYLTHQPFMVDNVVGALGYPLYVLNILGTAKLLGALALLAPGLPQLKEWAYAGFVFNLIGAAWSHAAVGHGLGEVMPPIVLLGVLAASYTLRAGGRRWAPPVSGGVAPLPA